MSMIMLSVIIPTYGRERQTMRAVHSVLAQDVDCEILVIDDASPVLNPLLEDLEQTGKIRLVRRPQNGGAGAARNTGLDHARGRFVCFLDSDDRMLRGTLANRLETAQAESRGHPAPTRIFGCGWREFGERNRQRFPVSSNRRADFFSSCWFAPGSCIIAPRELFSRPEGRFDENLRRLEDYELFARLAMKGLELVTDPTLGVEVSIGSTPPEDQVRSAFAEISAKFASWRSEGRIADQEIAASRAYMSFELAAVERRNDRLLLAGGHMLASFWHKPRLSLFPGPGWRS